jgi:serine/threonine protein kinase
LTQKALASGDLLDDKYAIDKLLGAGGMGAVYRATHLGTKRTVAIKVIHPQFSNNSEFVERFRREAEAAGRLRHPNVVDVTDFGFARTTIGRIAYLVMEYLDGCTLAEVLAEEPRLPREWVVDILEQVCSAVDEAHNRGIVHRDLKPENIWLEPNRRGGYTVKVLDFGLVKIDLAAIEARTAQGHPDTRSRPASPEVSDELQTLNTPSGVASESETRVQTGAGEESQTLIQSPEQRGHSRLSIATAAASAATSRNAGETSEEAATLMTDARSAMDTAPNTVLTRVGSIMGTPAYMSPEQCRGGQIDSRSDIYSLGVIAYRMLTGELPFSGTLDELTRQHATAEPPPLKIRNRRTPKRMAKVVMSALAKNPADRPASAAGFASSLRAAAEGSGALLRQAVSLYSERFPAFFKVSLLGYAPVIVAVIFMNFSDKFIPFEKLEFPWTVIVGFGLIGGMITANLIAHPAVAALTAPMVVQSIVAPLRPLRTRTALAALRRRWVMFSATTALVVAMILIGSVLLLIPGIVAAVLYALYAPVAVMESLGVSATLKRARALIRRSWSTGLVITVLQYALPVLVWIASVKVSLNLSFDENHSPKSFSFGMNVSSESALYQLLNILVTPMATIMTALLYLKNRRAGGESLRDAVDQFDELEIHRSKWQQQMRTRSLSRESSLPRPDLESK